MWRRESSVTPPKFPNAKSQMPNKFQGYRTRIVSGRTTPVCRLGSWPLSFLWRLDFWRFGFFQTIVSSARSMRVASLLFLFPSTYAETKVGDVFPALDSAGLVPLGSAEVPVITGKVVLVDFWASWCAPCKASFPMMARLHQDFSQRGLVVTAIGI